MLVVVAPMILAVYLFKLSATSHQAHTLILGQDKILASQQEELDRLHFLVDRQTDIGTSSRPTRVLRPCLEADCSNDRQLLPPRNQSLAEQSEAPQSSPVADAASRGWRYMPPIDASPSPMTMPSLPAPRISVSVEGPERSAGEVKQAMAADMYLFEPLLAKHSDDRLELALTVSEIQNNTLDPTIAVTIKGHWLNGSMPDPAPVTATGINGQNAAGNGINLLIQEFG